MPTHLPTTPPPYHPIPLRYLDLHAEIEPDESSWREAAVGRVIFTIKKAGEKAAWPRLLAEGAKKPQNMHMWFDKQEVSRRRRVDPPVRPTPSTRPFDPPRRPARSTHPVDRTF